MVSKPNQSLFVVFGQLLNASTLRCAQMGECLLFVVRAAYQLHCNVYCSADRT